MSVSPLAKPALRNVWLPVVAGALFLAGCAAAGTGRADTSDRSHLLARLRASEKASRHIEAQMVAAQQRLAAAYPAGTVTVPGEVVGQNEAADELAARLQDLRARLEKSRQEQRKLRTKLRQATGPNLLPARSISDPPAA